MRMDNQNVGRELEWDDVITNDDSGLVYVLLPEGDYDFVVDSFERQRHPGSEKLPPCNKAVLRIIIKTNEGIAAINHNLFLHTITEGMISSFFASIGQKKKNEPLKMNWMQVPGATGRCKVTVRRYKNKDGEEREANNITKFYPKDEAVSTPKFKAGVF
jgi:hypothetical protein